MRFDDPDQKLGIPTFADGPAADRGERRHPCPLSPDEMASLKQALARNQRRRMEYRASCLHVYVDGEERAQLSAGTSSCRPFTVPLSASYVEVFGDDDEGELLLAVFPLAELGPGEGDQVQQLSITHEGGQTIELVISPVRGEMAEVTEALMQITYLESPDRPATGRDPFLAWSDAAGTEWNLAAGAESGIVGLRPGAISRPMKIKVIGVGGGGGNTINSMIQAHVEGVDYIAANTDVQALSASLALRKIQLGTRLTKGLGAGGRPEIGRRAAWETVDVLASALDDADLVFIAAGMGGGTGTGAAPVIASLAKAQGCLTVAVVTKPFVFEGKQRFAQAEIGLRELRRSVDALITIPNQRLLSLVQKGTFLREAFQLCDGILGQAVQSISGLMTVTGLINLDLADVQTVMSGMGLALLGTGLAHGEDRAVKAAQRAISCPLLEESCMAGARGVLINITGSPDLTLFEVNEAVSMIRDVAHEDAHIIFGAAIDEHLEGAIRVTIIATGLAHAEAELPSD
jgi:cell division protein FtsZ